MWLTSQDEEFRAKRDDVLHVYYDTPQNEHIICLDEMTGMQILERLCPDIPMTPGMPVRREFEYKRHGTLTNPSTPLGSIKSSACSASSNGACLGVDRFSLPRN